jgi:hypothetical protein
MGEAPPSRVISGVDRLSRGNSRKRIEDDCGRNAFVAMMNLGIVGPDGHPLVSDEELGAEPENIVRQAALQASTVSMVREHLSQHSGASGEEVGAMIAEVFELRWSPASMQRTGAALKQWAEWCIGARAKKAPQGELFSGE